MRRRKLVTCLKEAKESLGQGEGEDPPSLETISADTMTMMIKNYLERRDLEIIGVTRRRSHDASSSEVGRRSVLREPARSFLRWPVLSITATAFLFLILFYDA
jgi:hypothetical protein